MQGEYTITLEDYQEAFTAHALVAVKRPLRRFVLESSALVQAALILWLVHYIQARPMPTVVPGSRPMVLEIEWTLIYLPPLVPALFWISQYCFSLLMLRFFVKHAAPITSAVPGIRTYKVPIVRHNRYPRFRAWALALSIVAAVIGLFLYGPLLDQDINRVAAGSGEHADTIWGNPILLMLYNAMVWAVATALWIYFSRLHQRTATSSNWKSRVAASTVNSFEASELNLKLSDSASHSEIQWRAFCRFVETENLFLLYLTEDLFHIIPKRAFSTLEDGLQFLGLLSREIKNGLVPERRDVGFPVELAVSNPLK